MRPAADHLKSRFAIHEGASLTRCTTVSESLRNECNQNLFNIADIGPLRPNTYAVPTLKHAERSLTRRVWTDNEKFWKSYTENSKFKHPRSRDFFLRDICLDELAIYGGSITDVILQRQPNDIDIVYFNDQGDSRQKGQAFAERVKEFIDDILTWMRKQNRKRTHQDELLYDYLSLIHI